MNTPDRKKANTDCTTPERMLVCCGFSSPLFASSHDSELPEQGTSTNRLGKGLHAPPLNIGDTNKFIWDHDSVPLSPPESKSRSIDFKQLGSSSLWPFQFLNEDLNFNRRSPIASSPSFHSAKNSGFAYAPTLMSTDSCSTSVIRNIAPAGLGEYDYHVDPSRKTSRFRSAWSWIFNSPRSSPRDPSRRKKLLIALFLVFAIFLSSAFLGLYRTNDHRSTAMGNGDTSISNVLSRKSHIRARILGANVTSEDLFDDLNSPQSTSLEWMANNDPLRLEPSDSGLVQRYASVVFYFSISSWHDDGVNEDDTSRWLSDKSICEWSGFTCNKVDGSSSSVVTGFEFVGGRINGPLVPEILIAFPDLEILRLAGVGLEQQLPNEIGLLSSLQVLSLGDNALTGIIPEGIGALKSLQLLGLQNNYFTNTIPLGIWTLSNLAALYLDGNALTGTIPVEARSMQSLIDLRLRDNRMTGVLDSLGSLSKLQICYLDTNSFDGAIPITFGLLQNMKSLTIYDNSLISSIPSELGNLQFLEHLIISGNKLSGTVPLEITMLPMLEHLWLKGNDLVGSVPTEICQRGDNSIDIQVDCNAVNCTCCKECM